LPRASTTFSKPPPSASRPPHPVEIADNSEDISPNAEPAYGDCAQTLPAGAVRPSRTNHYTGVGSLAVEILARTSQTRSMLHRPLSISGSRTPCEARAQARHLMMSRRRLPTKSDRRCVGAGTGAPGGTATSCEKQLCCPSPSRRAWCNRD
jgi:hypothetical protein